MRVWKDDPVHFVYGPGIEGRLLVKNAVGGDTLCGQVLVDGHNLCWTASVTVFQVDPHKCVECQTHEDWPLILLGELP